MFHAYDCGQVPYEEAHQLQAKLQRGRQLGLLGDTVLVLEHPPVITLGRSAKHEHVLFSKESLAQRGVALVETGRGGDVTYHGPGQLVVYPIIDLAPDHKDVRRYVWNLEEAMIRTTQDWGIEAGRVDKLNGAWIAGTRKIGAVGVRISRWITMHGLALNVNTELDAFRLIVPCGVQDRAVTSLRQELGHDAVEIAEVRQRLLQHLSTLLGQPFELHQGLPSAPDLEETVTGFG